MFRCAVLAAFVSTVAVLAAPVPPPSEKEQIAQLFGKVHAPSELYEFKLNNKALTIRTAGEPAREASPDRASTIPRVTRTVTGDFRATAKSSRPRAPNPKVKYESSMPESRAGLQVAGGFDHVEIELYQYFVVNRGVPGEQPNRVVWFNIRKGGNGEGRHVEHAKPATPIYLRISREKKVLTLAHSFDGKEWHESQVPATLRPLELPDEVSVSVYAAHSTYQVFDATFAEFTVEKLK